MISGNLAVSNLHGGANIAVKHAAESMYQGTVTAGLWLGMPPLVDVLSFLLAKLKV